ncbi:maleylpyruvate isomerase N-terminal domain-containing protein [Actinoplanes sp. RD1]|uniref:maleylpyruvate isomerase N-terminal domain-containing protein n=1 Tax=Actinoplanes sp. RD1 TaxID=3064538 RepID=UPI00274160DE|nr:maleylpyruvate isomerase N-terminal domain-containing protein [Actinoplanes sp. RD1]
MDFRWAYKSAVAVFTDLVYRVPEERWDGPGLGEWTLRELTGHVVGSALREVSSALGGPAATVDVASPEGYWAFARAAPADVVAAVRAAATEDARKTAAELGPEPAAGVAEYARAAAQSLSAAGDADVVLTAVGGMRVREWIPTRTFELVVHGLDVAAAAGVEAEFAEEVLAVVTLQAARVAATGKDKTLVLRALTGRATLPADFSVV